MVPKILLTILIVAAAVLGTAAASNVHTTKKISGMDAELLCGSGNPYADACKRIMASINPDANATEIIQAAANAILTELRTALTKASEVSKKVTTDKRIMSEVCLEALESALDYLEAIIYLAAHPESHSLDIRVWTDTVRTFQSSCLDELTEEAVKEEMKKLLGNSTDLTGSAVSMFHDLSKAFNALDGDNTARSLSENVEAGQPPKWVSAADRKLMGSANNGGLKPDIVVAQDGSGNFKTIQEAVSSVPKKNANRVVIYVKAGTYKEKVRVDASNIFMYGDGPRKSMVTWNDNVAHGGGISTSVTYTFGVFGKGFVAKAMGFMNDAGPDGHQAVALMVVGDDAAFFNCRINGFQDTLYYKANRQFFSNCVISGTIDFMFGSGRCIVQNSLIVVRRPMDNQFNTVTADGNDDQGAAGGLVIHNCRIVAEQKLLPDRFTIKSYLGRPWKAKARTVVMESEIGDVIRPEGWTIWQGANFHETCYYAEYNNRGPSGDPKPRVEWVKKHAPIDRKEASLFLIGNWLGDVTWLKAAGAKFIDGFVKS